MPEKKYLPIFISSTYEDLIPYREAVQKALIRLETIIKGMEYFGSRHGSPKDECLKVVSESKIFICIIGLKYGSLDEETGCSFVELEYEKAQEEKLPTLIYLLDEGKQPILTQYIDTGKKAKKLLEFKEMLKKKHTVSFFTTPEDLSQKVSYDLPEVLSEIGVSIKKDFFKEIINENTALDVLKSFLMRPKKQNGQNLILNIELKKDTQFFTTAIIDCNLHSLPVGDSFRFKTKCNIGGKTVGEFHIYTYGESADWIEKNYENIEEFKALVRLSWGIRTNLFKMPDGLSREREESIHGIIIKKIIAN